MKKVDEPRQVAVAVRDIHKEFVLPQHKRTSVKQVFVNIVSRNGKVIQRVLDGVDFEVYEGDFFGIVGRNGSGKSTLLKILAGVYTPTSGEVVLNGGLTPFIELGVGFNPELSGRDNVFLNGALLGFSRKEMQNMYDEIVDFAELVPFMDQKLKNYSSGMQVRLAFSIAIKAHSDILIFDEVLAVGDEAFQRKCLDVFERYKTEHQTVILVTHDMEMVRRFCSRALLISEGRIIELGDPRAVADVYSQLNQIAIDAEVAMRSPGRSQYLKAQILGTNSKPQQSFRVGEKMRLAVTWNGLAADRIESLGVNIFKQSGEHITGVSTRFSSHATGWKEKANIGVEFELNIIPGKYRILVEAFEEEGELVDALHDGPEFSVIGSHVEWSGLTNLPHKWLG